MTTRNVFCRVLQPVPRIIDPRKICDSIEPVYLTWYFFPRFFFTLFFFYLITDMLNDSRIIEQRKAADLNDMR